MLLVISLFNKQEESTSVFSPENTLIPVSSSTRYTKSPNWGLFVQRDE